VCVINFFPPVAPTAIQIEAFLASMVVGAMGNIENLFVQPLQGCVWLLIIFSAGCTDGYLN